MQSSKFTLWTDQRYECLRERVCYKKIKCVDPDDLRSIMFTHYRCDFCGNFRSVTECGFYVISDPDTYLQEDELLSCRDCGVPKFARMLLNQNTDIMFHVSDATAPYFCAYNKRHNYYIPATPLFLSQGRDVLITAGITKRLRHDPYHQIDRTLFQLISEKLEL